MASSYLPKIEELFDEAKYEECKQRCLEAMSRNPTEEVAKRLRQVQRKCDIHLTGKTTVTSSSATTTTAAAASAAAPAAPLATAAASAPVAAASPPVETAAAKPAASSPAAAAATAATDDAKPSSSSALPVSAPRFEWFQSPTTVTLTFYIKGRTEADVKVDVQDRSVEVSIALGEGRSYNYEVETLFGAVDPKKTVQSVRPTKIEVVLTKATTAQWPTLEMKGGDLVAAHIPAAAAASAEPPSQKHLPYPSSKGKDWSKFKLSKDEEKDLDSTNSLNDFFKTVFTHGDESQRRAMVKSFTESGGTVLSTNWAEVGDKKVEVSPPAGMQPRKWNDL